MLKEILLIAEELASNGMRVSISYSSLMQGIEITLNGKEYLCYLEEETPSLTTDDYYHREDMIQEIRKVRNEWMNNIQKDRRCYQ